MAPKKKRWRSEPLTMFLNLNDANFFAVVFGSGPRAIVAHGGWAGSWELWCEPFTWLSKTWRTIAYDHRGTGATIAPPASITFEGLVGDLFAILDALQIHSCVLAAESAGAATAVQAAIRQPERFSGLVLVDGLLYGRAPLEPDPFRAYLESDFEAAIAWFVDACVPESEPNSAAVRRWGRQILARSPQPAALRLLDCMTGVDVRPLLTRLSQPTLLIHGDSDALVPLEDSQWAAAQIAKSHLSILRGAGHVPTVTRPQEVSAAIDDFFT
jgi:pimeloyl-ACP methyl ester carboxylesterase